MDMPQNQDFKYVLQDFGNIYISAHYSYEEMLKVRRFIINGKRSSGIIC